MRPPETSISSTSLQQANARDALETALGKTGLAFTSDVAKSE